MRNPGMTNHGLQKGEQQGQSGRAQRCRKREILRGKCKMIEISAFVRIWKGD
jgi:hypothetical protein